MKLLHKFISQFC